MLTYDVCEGGAVWFDNHLVIDARGQPPGDKVVSKTASVGRLEAGRKYPLVVEFFKSAADSDGPHKWHFDSQICRWDEDWLYRPDQRRGQIDNPRESCRDSNR